MYNIIQSDLPGVTIDRDMLDKFVAENGFIGWYEDEVIPKYNFDHTMRIFT